jgi:hypothetical protein
MHTRAHQLNCVPFSCQSAIKCAYICTHIQPRGNLAKRLSEGHANHILWGRGTRTTYYEGGAREPHTMREGHANHILWGRGTRTTYYLFTCITCRVRAFTYTYIHIHVPSQLPGCYLWRNSWVRKMQIAGNFWSPRLRTQIGTCRICILSLRMCVCVCMCVHICMDVLYAILCLLVGECILTCRDWYIESLCMCICMCA